MLNYKVSKNDIHIEDSYKVTSKQEMIDFLSFLLDNYTETECPILFLRSMTSLVNEWRAHNLLYKLHIFRSRTKDVDLNDNSKFVLCLYAILSFFYF